MRVERFTVALDITHGYIGRLTIALRREYITACQVEITTLREERWVAIKLRRKVKVWDTRDHDIVKKTKVKKQACIFSLEVRYVLLIFCIYYL